MTDTLLALSTDHCRITPLFADDARALAAITDETVTSRVHFLPAPFTEADARALIAKSGGGDVFHAVRDASGLDLNGVIGVPCSAMWRRTWSTPESRLSRFM